MPCYYKRTPKEIEPIFKSKEEEQKFSRLLTIVKPKIKYLAREWRFRSPLFLIQDIEQEITISLMKRFSNYLDYAEPLLRQNLSTEEILFRGWVNRETEWLLLSIWRKDKRTRISQDEGSPRIVRTESEFYKNAVATDDTDIWDKIPDPAATATYDDINFRVSLENILSKAKIIPEEQRIIFLFLEGYSNTDIDRKLGYNLGKSYGILRETVIKIGKYFNVKKRGRIYPKREDAELRNKEIRKRYKEGNISMKKLGKKHQISAAAIEMIVNRKGSYRNRLKHDPKA